MDLYGYAPYIVVRMNYYDFILAFVPLTLFGLTGALTVGGLALTLAIPVAASVAAGLIGHAMFVNAPVGSPVAPAVDAADSAVAARDEILG